MKLHKIAAVVSGICCFAPLGAVAAPPAAHSAKSAPMQYRAVCGMVYSAAEAKKDHYICPMDGKKMTAIKPSAKPAAKKLKS